MGISNWTIASYTDLGGGQYPIISKSFVVCCQILGLSDRTKLWQSAARGMRRMATYLQEREVLHGRTSGAQI